MGRASLRAVILDAWRRSGLSQSALARLAGVSQSTLNQYLGGRIDLSGQRLDRLIAVLAIRVEAPERAELERLGERLRGLDDRRRRRKRPPGE